MRKGIDDRHRATMPFNQKSLDELKVKGYRYVQVKGLTADNHYDYIEPSMLILVPLRELPTDPAGKDIYEPIDSEILTSWASDNQAGISIFV